MPTLCRGSLPQGVLWGVVGAFALLLALPVTPSIAAAPVKPYTAPGGKAAREQNPASSSRIAAVVNGEVISDADIANRARLFAISTGLPLSADVIARLRPQILKQLIDERLRMQESQRRKIVIQDAQIAAAIREIETRNNMPAGALMAKLKSDGVSTRTLIDQIRAQLAWSRMLHDSVGEGVKVTPAEVAEQQKLMAQRTGQTEYRISEIFIPVDDPAKSADARHFAETVITELHAGAAFPLVAAQFSQNQAALSGGQIGWVQTNQLDPAVAQIVTQMPVGAVSNPVQVPGGYTIVALQAKREIGRDLQTVVTVRQVFFPFSEPLTDPQHPTEQQQQVLAKARAASGSVKSCDQMEALAKANNHSDRPVNPGEIRVEGVNPPAFRQLLSTIPLGKASEPLISRDGIAVITVCTREQKNVGEVTATEMQNRLVNERVEMLSRQMMRDLHRKANIDERDSGA